MKKTVKRILALVAAMMLVVSTAVFAAETTNTLKNQGSFSITITKDATDKAAHTYGAYQIFKGDLAETNGSKVLSNIEWGDNISSSSALIVAVATATGKTLAADATAADVAKAISDANLDADSEQAQALADAFEAALSGGAKSTATVNAEGTTATISGLPGGYYLVKDENAVAGEGAQTRYILEVVSSIEVKEKASVPQIEKKVKEKNDTTGAESGWQDAADYDIGDTIPYQITGTLPEKFADFDTYKVYTITDTLSEGLTPPAADGITITLNGQTNITSNFDVVVNGQVITITLNGDMKLIASAATDKIVVDYTAVLNEKAVIGAGGNPNKVKLDFTNNPNGEGDGEFGTTPEDKVTVFTYQIDAHKVGEDGTTALEGAGFTLYKMVGGVKTKVGEEIKGVTTFEFKGTDAGEYVLEETTVPAGYNKADDITFTVTATYDTSSQDPQLTDLTVTPSDAGFTCTVASGLAETTVINHGGATLPSTGGMGTTIFYVIGGILVLAAVIILISKKRVQQ